MHMNDFYIMLGKIKTENRRLTKTRVGLLRALSVYKAPCALNNIKRWFRKNHIHADRSTITANSIF